MLDQELPGDFCELSVEHRAQAEKSLPQRVVLRQRRAHANRHHALAWTPIYRGALLTTERDEQQAGVHVVHAIDLLELALAHIEPRATVAARDDKLERRYSWQLSFGQPGRRATIT